MLTFEWEGFDLESVWKDTSLSLSLYVCVEREESVPQSPAERDSLCWRNVAEFQLQFSVLVPWSQFYMSTVIKSQCFYENCSHGRSLFLRTAIMVAILITLKLYDF